jgi:hypothetical protein
MIDREIVGTLHGIVVEVAAWDGSAAEVDLSCAGMFTQTLAGGRPVGGLAHLDQALGGALTALRDEGRFGATAGEILHIERPPAAVAASAVLIVGLGAPQGWTAAGLAPAVRLAASIALGLGVRTAAFAPSMLDSGLHPEQTADAPAAMIAGLAAAIGAHVRLRALDLAGAPALSRWSFDVGQARFAGAVDSFRSALAAVRC